MFKKFFLSGLKAFVPGAVTIAIVIWIFSSIEAFFSTIIKNLLPYGYYFDGLGIIVGLVLILFLGMIINAWAIKHLYRFADSIIKKIPFIKTIYTSIQDLVDFIEKSQDKDYNQVVLCRVGRFKVLAFVTRQSFDGLPEEYGDKDSVLVYMPMSYQIGGYMLSVPRRHVTPINIPANKAMTLILTAGMMGAESAEVREVLSNSAKVDNDSKEKDKQE